MGPGGVQEGAAGEGKAGPAYLSGRAMVDCQTARRRVASGDAIGRERRRRRKSGKVPLLTDDRRKIYR